MNLIKKNWIYVIIALIIILLAVFMFSNKTNTVAIDDNQIAQVKDSTQVVESTSTNIDSEIKKTNINTKKMDTEKVSKPGDTLTVNYVGTLEDGTKFDSSLDRGTPFKFIVGVGQVIKGWDEGMLGMKVGEKKHLVIPGEKAYGANGVPDYKGGFLIPPNATLIFDVEVLNIESK